jgi:outer membrane protein assembly factor BamD (BamD/ComL family)
MQTPPAPRRALICLAAFVWLSLAMLTSAGDAHAELTIDADSQYRYAQSRFEAGAYDEAIIEFNRFVFFFPEDPRIPQARFTTGLAHYRAGRYQPAAAMFNQLTMDYRGLPYQDDAFFMLSRSHARQGMIEQAILDLRNLLAVAGNADVIDRARYELGWLHVDGGRWNQAEAAFGSVSPANQDRFEVKRLNAALALSDDIPTKNPTTAGILSIVPGGGQLYCGRYRDAFTAFALNAGLIWAAWESFDNEQYALGSVITFVGFGFYAGNIYGAVSSAHKYNRDRINDFRDNLNRHRQISLSLGPVPGGASLSLSVAF